MKTYLVTLKGDDNSNGEIRILTCARNPEVAIDIVCKHENAPKSAVIDCSETCKGWH